MPCRLYLPADSEEDDYGVFSNEGDYAHEYHWSRLMGDVIHMEWVQQ